MLNKEKFIIDNGKVRFCRSNIAKMTVIYTERVVKEWCRGNKILNILLLRATFNCSFPDSSAHSSLQSHK